MLRHPSGVPIDPNCKATVHLFRHETCVYGASRATLPPLTFALWAEPKTLDVLAVVEELIALGADPNLTGDEDVSDGSGMGSCRYRGTLTDVSPLCHAVQRGSVECVLRLLAAGANPDARSGTLGPQGGLPETFLGRNCLCTGAERDDILALLAAARQFRAVPSHTLAEGIDRRVELSAALRCLLDKRVARRAESATRESPAQVSQDVPAERRGASAQALS